MVGFLSSKKSKGGCLNIRDRETQPNTQRTPARGHIGNAQNDPLAQEDMEKLFGGGAPLGFITVGWAPHVLRTMD